MHDSGKREQFDTGAVRDTAEGKSRPDLISPYAQMRKGEWLRKGAEKYAERNWEKGMKISRCIASLERHLQEYKMGLTNEDHLAAIAVNAEFIMHYEKMIEMGILPADLDDMPKYEQQVAKQPEDLLDKEAWETQATIECVPSCGWQIRLENGWFLIPKIEACEMVFEQSTAPFYYLTKRDAENILADYLRGKP